MSSPIYLDYNATTPVDRRVLDAMLPYFTDQFGNAASSSHAYGWSALKAVELARAQVAGLIGASAHEIVFTSGSTEALNLAIKGAAEAYATKGDHIITCVTEHKAVLDTCARLETEGKRVTVLPVDRQGHVSLDDLRDAITDRTVLVALMMANNEIGTIHPVAAIGAICRERGVLFLTDATQAAGKLPIHVDSQQIDLLSLSAHKLYGPKGVGALYVRRRDPRVRLVSQQDGGGHERGLRSGTLNVPGIVGLGVACQIAHEELETDAARLSAQRDRLEQELTAQLDGVTIHGDPASRLPQTTNLCFDGVDAGLLMSTVQTLAVSPGSACTSGSGAASHVLTSLGLSDEAAHGSIRISLGRFTTDDQISEAIRLLVHTIPALRATGDGLPLPNLLSHPA